MALVDHNGGYPSGNFAAISTGVSNGRLTLQAWAKGIGPLHSGTHTATVQVTSGGVLIVYLDGQQVLQQAEPGLTATSLLVFTTGTSSSYEVNTIRNVAISATG